MEAALPAGLEIAAAWERGDEGSPEERACFALFTIKAGNACLTEGYDSFVNTLRAGPLVSAYHAAEWFAWNWWRLRWEPRSAAPDWAFAHRMAAIGEGYVWPNITVFSDGVRTALISNPSSRADSKPFRYVGGISIVLPSTSFEGAVDAFLTQVVGRLRQENIGETNLDRVWRDVAAERADPAVARRRKLEALLGRDPDEVEMETLERLLADADSLGELAVDEIAADRAQGGALLTAEALQELAQRSGFDASPRDAIRLQPGAGLPRSAETPAWRLGAAAAKFLREQENLDTAPIFDETLARMAGTTVNVLSAPAFGPNMAFALDRNANASRIVLRSKWKAGRRFELARLLGDRIVSPGNGRLYPATRAYTYRQKMQRSFAAELLSPFEAVDEMLAGDYSTEHQQDIAEHFDVSPITIRTLLVNHGRVEREMLEEEPEAAA